MANKEMETTNGNWVKIYRDLTAWEWYTNTPVKVLFIHCLIKANYQVKKWRGLTIPRGSFVTSVASLSQETTLSVQQIRTALNKLQSTGEIAVKSTNKFTIVSICNYAIYQGVNETEQQTNNKQITNKQQTNNNNIRNKERKEIKKDINITAEPADCETQVTPEEPKKPNGFNFRAALISAGCPGQLAADYMAVRNRKRAANTQTAFNGLQRDITAAGYDWPTAIQICVERAWIGFKKEWIDNNNNNKHDDTIKQQRNDRRREGPVGDFSDPRAGMF